MSLTNKWDSISIIVSRVMTRMKQIFYHFQRVIYSERGGRHYYESAIHMKSIEHNLLIVKSNKWRFKAVTTQSQNRRDLGVTMNCIVLYIHGLCLFA